MRVTDPREGADGPGKLYRHTGKRAQAKEHLTTATREMDMRFWLKQAEAGLREVN